MARGPIGSNRIARKVRDAVSQPGFVRIALRGLCRLRKVQDGRGQLRICGTERKRISAAAATDVEQPKRSFRLTRFAIRRAGPSEPECCAELNCSPPMPAS